MSAGLVVASHQDTDTITSRDFTANQTDALDSFAHDLVSYSLKAGDPAPWPPMSPDVMAHIVQQHPCHGPVDAYRCPCNCTLLIVCPACDEDVLLQFRAGYRICEHAAPLLEAKEEDPVPEIIDLTSYRSSASEPEPEECEDCEEAA